MRIRGLLTTVAALGLVLGSAPAATADTGSVPCVGVVIDGRAIGAGVVTRCSKGPAGRDAVEVLQGAGLRVRIGATGGYAGFLCQIDGLPAGSSDDDGCASAADGYRYWGFFVRAPGAPGWTYATKGVRGHRPVDGGQIGFRFETTPAELPPPVYAQDRVCPPVAAPRPSAAPVRTSAPARTAAPAAPPRAAAPARTSAPVRQASPARPAAPARTAAPGRSPAPRVAQGSAPRDPAAPGVQPPARAASGRPPGSQAQGLPTSAPTQVPRGQVPPGERSADGLPPGLTVAGPAAPTSSGTGASPSDAPVAADDVPAGTDLLSSSQDAPDGSRLATFLLGAALVLGLAGFAGLRRRRGAG